jgi:hypothetical protein
MKVWLLAGAITVVTVPFASAAEAECQVDDTRRQVQVRIDNGAPGGSAPSVARPTVAQREPAPTEMAQREDEEPQRRVIDRRRSGKPIPDAELIGPRRAL